MRGAGRRVSQLAVLVVGMNSKHGEFKGRKWGFHMDLMGFNGENHQQSGNLMGFHGSSPDLTQSNRYFTILYDTLPSGNLT